MMDDLIDDFVAETRDNLEALTSQLLNWEKNPNDKESVDEIFRFVHTVKGSCGFLDLPRLLELSHAAEDIMSEAREGRILPTAALVSRVLAVVDQIGLIVNTLDADSDIGSEIGTDRVSEHGAPIHNDDQDLIKAMYAASQQAQKSDKDVSDNQSAFEHPIAAEPISTIRPSLINSLGIQNIDEAENNNEDPEIIPTLNDGLHYDGGANRTVRVSLKLLDNLMSGVSDLVLARNEVSRKLRDALNGSDMSLAFGRLSSSVAEMRDAVGLMRMQNIDRLFSVLPRLVRDIVNEGDKEIKLVIEGGEVEVDREMVEALRDPLTHIIRNSADHGIENKEDRIAAGKNPIGTIQINARQSGNQILIEISDDGAGIDLNRLREKVISSKLMSAARWDGLSEKAKLNMIFAPGLSTAKKVTNISGRGVGMDVVKTNINRVSGSIDIENFEGQGLKLTLSLPLTLSIIAGLSLRCGDKIFAIPRNSVQELILYNNPKVAIEEVGGTYIAIIRGKRYSYARLSDLVGIAVNDDDQQHNSRTLAVIKPAIGKSYVLDVDAVVDNEELVVKPGAPLLMAAGLYAGTSLSDSGQPLLLFDANAIASKIGVGNIEDENEDTQESEDKNTEVKFKSALLFEMLDGTQKAIRLAVLDRLEEVQASDIGVSGGISRVKIKDSLYEIFGLSHLPESGSVKMLRLSDGEQCKFLAVAEVIDIFKLDGNIAPSGTPEKIEGILSINNRQVELINPYQFFEHGALSHISENNKALCYIDAGQNDEWSHRMLLPLLSAAGYRVSTERQDAAIADVILTMESSHSGNISNLFDDNHKNLVRLRQNMAINENMPDSIYRYDRLGLLAAIEAKISKK